MVTERDALYDRVDRVLDKRTKYKKRTTNPKTILVEELIASKNIELSCVRSGQTSRTSLRSVDGCAVFCWIETLCLLGCVSRCPLDCQTGPSYTISSHVAIFNGVVGDRIICTELDPSGVDQPSFRTCFAFQNNLFRVANS